MTDDNRGRVAEFAGEEGEEAADLAEAHGSTLARKFVSVWLYLGLTVTNFVYVALRFVPFGARFWHGLAKLAVDRYHKRAGGDRMGFRHLPNGQVQLTPVKWVDKGDELDGRTGYKAKGEDKVWRAGADGRANEHLGKTPIVFLDDDATEKGSMLQCRVAEAVDVGETHELYHEATIQKLEISPDPALESPGEAMADGGQVQSQYIVRDRGELEDVLVDIGTGDKFNGQVVSLSKYRDLYPEITDTGEMKRQETRGYLAGMDPSEYKAFLIKVLIVAGLIAIAGLIGPELIGALLGGGGGGSGGSVIPQI